MVVIIQPKKPVTTNKVASKYCTILKKTGERDSEGLALKPGKKINGSREIAPIINKTALQSINEERRSAKRPNQDTKKRAPKNLSPPKKATTEVEICKTPDKTSLM